MYTLEIHDYDINDVPVIMEDNSKNLSELQVFFDKFSFKPAHIRILKKGDRYIADAFNGQIKVYSNTIIN